MWSGPPKKRAWRFYGWRACARTCREWVARLRQNENVCVRLVGEETYRTWLLYLAASAANFDAGTTGVFSVLMGKGQA